VPPRFLLRNHRQQGDTRAEEELVGQLHDAVHEAFIYERLARGLLLARVGGHGAVRHHVARGAAIGQVLQEVHHQHGVGAAIRRLPAAVADLQAGVVLVHLVGAPTALVERRVGDHHVRLQARMGVTQQRVADGDLAVQPVQDQVHLTQPPRGLDALLTVE